MAMRGGLIDREVWRDRLFLTVTEAAELMRVDPRTLRRALEAGQVPGVRVGNVWRIPVEKFRHLVEDE
jgi:excisionase family DNA binding protein